MRHLTVLLVGIGLVLGLAGCSGGGSSGGSSANKADRDITIEFRDAADTEHPGYLRTNLSGTARYLYVSQEVILGTDAVARAEIDSTEGSSNRVTLYLTDDGREAFAEITRNRIGKRVGIMVDGLLLTAPLVMAEINSGRAVIEGRFDEHEAERIVRHLNAP